jgi:ribose transport system permease protein
MKPYLRYAGLLGVLLLLIGFFSLRTQHFFQTATAISIANQIPDLTLIAVGMTLVLVVGGIDLSVGSVLAVSAALMGVLMVDFGWPLGFGMVAAILLGGFCGWLNGTISVLGRIPSFIVTLGMLEIARGLTKTLTSSQTKYIGSSIATVGEPLPGLHLSPACLIALVAVLAGEFLLTRTVFGRYCVAIGTNAEAVRMSGIRSSPYTISVFTLCGALSGFAGVAQVSRLSAVDPNAAIGIELSAIAACVIGGTSLMGGRGSVISTFFGVLIIAVLQTGLAQLGVSDANKQIVTGSVIILAVLLDAMRSRWASGMVK